MARFLPVLLAAVALLAAGPSTAEGFWRGVLKRAVLPDAILRRLHAETTSTVSEGVGGGTGRSTSGLDYDDYTRLPPAAATKEEAAPFGYDYRAAPSEGGGRARWGSEARDGDDVPFNYGYKEPISELGGTEGGSVTSARSGDGGTAKGTGRSTSGLDYDDYTRLPPAATKEEYEYYYKAAPIPSEGGGAARNDDDVPFNYDYKEPSSELGGTDGGEATSESGAGNKETVGPPLNYSYKGHSEATSESEAGNKEAVGPPFDYSYKGPSEATSESEEVGNKETVGPPFNYSYKATAPEERRGGQKEEKATTTTTTTVFFHEESVRVGARLRFRFPAATPAPLGLLPRRAADSVPFSTEALPHILALLRVPLGSVQAAAMAETLRICEWPPLAGESKFCAASLEALVERAMAALGTRDVRAVTSALPRAGASVQTYAVRAVRRVVDGGAGFFVACHDEAYPYTVYRCHTTGPARAYLMEMESAASGIKITVGTVCHTDTSQWNPEHLSFKLLGTRPGGEPICHLMPYGHIIWAKNVNRSPA